MCVVKPLSYLCVLVNIFHISVFRYTIIKPLWVGISLTIYIETEAYKRNKYYTIFLCQYITMIIKNHLKDISTTELGLLHTIIYQ